jgi:hypothetical protein
VRAPSPAILAILALASAAIPVAADEAATCQPGGAVVVDGLGTPSEDLLRLAELMGAAPLEPGVMRRAALRARVLCADGPALPWKLSAAPAGDRWVAAVPLRLTTVLNTRYPSGGNDGLLWAGRGASSLVAGGVAFRYGVLSGAFVPEATWSQNDWFELRSNGAAGDLAFGTAYYGSSIDLPQRFGAGPYSAAALGDSVLRLDWKGVALGVSNERMWWGPGLQNALVLSDNAAGFPHAFLGTSRPVDVWIGHVEATAFWGRVFRTRYFDGGSDPLFIGLAVDYAPRWIPGLTLGLGRTFLQPWRGREALDYVPFLQSFWKKDLEPWYGDAGDNPEDNQLASVSWRWVFPKAGLEIYGEWGREDHDWSVYRFVEDFDWTKAYLIGLQKVFPLSAQRFVRLHVEVIDLQEPRPPASERGLPTWYIHNADLGYTNQGQVLGASIGPGADSQRLAVDVFGPKGRIGGFLERVRRNESYFYREIEPIPGEEAGHDAELTAGVRQVLFAGPVDVSWELSASYRWNRDFFGDEPNFRGAVTLSVPLARPAAAGARAGGHLQAMANERKGPDAGPKNEPQIGPSGGPPDDRERQYRGSTPTEDVLEQWIEKGEPKTAPAENPKDEDAGRS